MTPMRAMNHTCVSLHHDRPGLLDDICRPAGQNAPMKFLDQVQADLKQAVLQHHRDLVVQILQRRYGELTLGDLRQLLASALGRGLDDVRVAELFAATAASPGKGGKQAKARRRTPSTSKERPSKAAAKGTGKPKKIPLEKLIEAVFAVLQSAKKPLSSTEIGAKVKAHRTTVRDLLHTLNAANRVVISGSRQFTRYALPGSALDARREAQTDKPRRRKVARTKTRERAPIPAVLTQADYDAAVLANLHALGSMSSSQLQASVGGSLNEVRAALQRLIAHQQASRVGQAKNTRYVPTAPKPADT